MKIFSLVLFAGLYATSAWSLENVSLQSGGSVIIDKYLVSCGSSENQKTLYRCGLGVFKVYLSDWQYDIESAKAQAQERCRSASNSQTISACYATPKCKNN